MTPASASPNSRRAAQARHWIANHLHFPDGRDVQFFEVNIRITGGLLSAYFLSGGDELFLHKAEQLGDRLLPAFNTTTGLPVTRVQVRKDTKQDTHARYARIPLTMCVCYDGLLLHPHAPLASLK